MYSGEGRRVTGGVAMAMAGGSWNARGRLRRVCARTPRPIFVSLQFKVFLARFEPGAAG